MYVQNPAVFGLPPVRATPKPAPRLAPALLAALRSALSHPETGPRLRAAIDSMDAVLSMVPDAVLAVIAVEVLPELFHKAFDSIADKLDARLKEG